MHASCAYACADSQFILFSINFIPPTNSPLENHSPNLSLSVVRVRKLLALLATPLSGCPRIYTCSLTFSIKVVVSHKSTRQWSGDHEVGKRKFSIWTFSLVPSNSFYRWPTERNYVHPPLEEDKPKSSSFQPQQKLRGSLYRYKQQWEQTTVRTRQKHNEDTLSRTHNTTKGETAGVVLT